MRESASAERRPSKPLSEHLFVDGRRNGPVRTIVRVASKQAARIPKQLSRFGAVVCALWPIKPALNLAQRLGCSERAAEFYIDGKRKPSAKAIHVVTGEILSD